MISDDTAALIEALLCPDVHRPVENRARYGKALDEFRAHIEQQRERAVAAAPLDQEQVQRVIDVTLVEDAIRRHARIMLANMTTDHAPKPGDLFPSHHYTQSQWHMALIIALSAVPVDEAAAHLREEALQALDTNPKEGP